MERERTTGYMTGLELPRYRRARVTRCGLTTDEADACLFWARGRGLSNIAVAGHFGVSRNAVWQRWQRLQQHLRRRLPWRRAHLARIRDPDPGRREVWIEDDEP